MAAKLALSSNPSTQKLIDELIDVMHLCGTHFTNFFRLIQDHAGGDFSVEEMALRAVECS
jgi:uncharacterized protein YdiU (UPF0061 family)